MPKLVHFTISNLIAGPSGIFAPDLNINFESDRESLDDSDEEYHKHDDGMGDEEKETYEEKKVAAAAAYTPNWPNSVYAYLKFGYDNTLARQMTRQGTTFKKWIDSVMTHVQTYYRHKSLPTKIQFKVITRLQVLYFHLGYLIFMIDFDGITDIILSFFFNF